MLSHVPLFAIPWTIACQAPLSIGFSRQEYWNGLPCPPPGDFPNPGIKPRSSALQADYLSSEPLGKPKNTGVGSLSLLQENFPTQESNQGLLHCTRNQTRLPKWLSGKESSCQCTSCRRHGFNPWVGKIPLRRKWQPTLVFLPGKSYAQRSLVGYSPWGCKELDMTELLSVHSWIIIST